MDADTIHHDYNSSFEAILSAQRPLLLRFCQRVIGRADYAEDLVQETLMEAWRCRQQLRDPQRLSQWLGGIARNICYNWLRKQARHAPSIPLASHNNEPFAIDACSGDELASDFDVEIELERKDLITLLDQALALLPAETRTILIERYVQESSVAEIADFFGIAPGTAAMRLQRGKLTFRRILTSRFSQEIASYMLQPDGMLAWRDTNIWCMRCGRSHLRVRLPEQATYLNFICPTCDGPTGDNGSIHCPLEKSIKGYKRALQHSIKTYQPDSTTQTLPCMRCHVPMRLWTSSALDLPAWCKTWNNSSHSEHENFLYSYCSHCHIWLMLVAHGFLLAHPAVYRFWQRQQRIVTLPVGAIDYAGRPAQLIRYESVGSAAQIAAIVATDRYEVLQVFEEGA